MKNVSHQHALKYQGQEVHGELTRIWTCKAEAGRHPSAYQQKLKQPLELTTRVQNYVLQEDNTFLCLENGQKLALNDQGAPNLEQLVSEILAQK